MSIVHAFVELFGPLRRALVGLTYGSARPAVPGPGPLRPILLLIMLAGLPLLCSTAEAQARAGCRICEETLELTLKDFDCLLERLPGYLKQAEKTDPQLIVKGCIGVGAAEAREPVRTGTLPTLPCPPSGDIACAKPGDAPIKASAMVFLSRKQLVCLNVRSAALREVGDPVRIDFADCTAP